MKVLVTGAAGFLGSRVVLDLLDRGHAVRALVRSASTVLPAEWNGRAEVVCADLRTAPSLDSLFEGIDVLVHLAATVRGTSAEQFSDTVVCTERLLDGMRRAGSTSRLVLASSFSVYDWSAADKILTEDSALESNPGERDDYTVAKVAQERVVRRMADEVRWVVTVLRPGFIYGPGAAVAAGAGIKVGCIFFVVAPSARLRLTHVDNCAAAFANAVERGVSGTFNIVDDEHITAWRYAGRMLSNSSLTVRVPVPYRAGLAAAWAAERIARPLGPAVYGKLPGVLVPGSYRARFKPLEYDNRRAKESLGWTCTNFFAAGCEVT